LLGLKSDLVNSRISVLIRIHCYTDLGLLEEAVASVAVQDYADLEIVLLAQNASEAELQTLHHILRRLFLEQHPGGSVQIHNLKVDPPKDSRSALLNLGLKTATGAFLAFLDFDDLLKVGAYTSLVQSLGKSQAVLAAGGATVVYSSKVNGQWKLGKEISPFSWGQGLADLFKENFIPIHSFVLNRSLIDENDLFFDESLVLCEDYDFLLRLAAKYRFDFSLLKSNFAIYRAREDGSNTNPSFSLNPSSKERALLAAANAAITYRKSELVSKMSPAMRASLEKTSKKVLIGPRAKIGDFLKRFPQLKERLGSLARKVGIKERKF